MARRKCAMFYRNFQRGKVRTLWPNFQVSFSMVTAFPIGIFLSEVVSLLIVFHFCCLKYSSVVQWSVLESH